MIDQIKCPNCGHDFDVEQALAGKLEAQYKADFEKRVAEQAAKFNQERDKLEAEREAFAKAKAKENEMFKQRLEQRMEQEKETISKETNERFEQQIKALKDENEKKKEENRELRSKEIELLQKENELKEKTEELELAVKKKMLEQQKEIEDKARVKERESFELEKIKLLKQIEDNKKLAEEMKRKAEQGSMQLQGEVQELALEALLKSTYPFDNVQEVPKGVRGADCIQTVVNNLQKICGSIVYESKRTKAWGGDWIEKLKQDQITCKADIAVLVTQTLPSGMDRFGNKNGVWVCGFHEVKSLSLVLRQMLIKTHAAKLADENKGDKMELLYNFLTSNEFVQNIKRIVENYDSMINQLNSEKKAMHKIWSTREKQIWVVQENVSSLFGSIKGIAGAELDTANILELPEKTIDEF